MKETLLLYARYNIWANDRVISTLQKLNDEKIEKTIISSFASIKATVYHMWSAEYIWLQRLQLTERPVWIESIFEGSFDEACAGWRNTSKALVDFIEKQYDDKAMEHVLQYYNLKKQSVKLPVHIALMQVFNHTTFHRGQIVTMLRQLGVKKIPSTDVITFYK